MKKIDQNQIVERYIKEIRQRRRFLNCQYSIRQIEELVHASKIFAYELENAFFLVENKGQLYNLYYLSDTMDWLQSLSVLKEQYSQMVISIVGKHLQEIETIFSENRYFAYKTYQRLRCTDKLIDFANANYCDMTDKEALRQMMDNTFDVFSDHIPLDEELESFIANRQIICVRDNDLVAGFVIFEDKGKTSYIRMVCVDKGYQGKGIANELMKMYFYTHAEFSSFTLWYDVKNERARSLYKKWNYEDEQLYNLIYIV